MKYQKAGYAATGKSAAGSHKNATTKRANRRFKKAQKRLVDKKYNKGE